MDTRTLQLVSGSSNTVFQAPNSFILTLPSTGLRLGRDEISLKSLTIYYSWANISAAQGNNTLSYIWPGQGSFPVIFADGIWSFTDILSYLEQVMTQNGHYLVNAEGVKVFYISLQLNSVLYCLSLTCTPLPATLPASWSNPSSMVLSAVTPQLIISTASANLTGFTAGSYPPTPRSSLYQINSGIPQITQVTSLNITCDLVDNRGFSLIPSVLTSFTMTPGTSPGSLIQHQPYILDWVPTQQQVTATRITVSITDQLGRPLVIRDTSGVVITLNIRRRA
jgi:hypothetical protein